jgi:hypothetical protein
MAALFLLVALRFFPSIADGRLYGPYQDNVFSYGPMFSETARLALHGTFPYYLPSFGTGFPLYQSPHYSVCYPFYFFGLLDYGGPLQSLYTLTHLSMFHRFLFAMNLYIMLRCAQISPFAALTSASIGVFATNTELYANWITMAASYTWMPLFVGGAILVLRFPGRFLGILVLGGSAGMIALASASQSIAHALFFSVIFFGVGVIWIFRNHGLESALRVAMSLTAAAGVAFGLAAVTAIPVYLGIREMIRFVGNEFVLGHQSLPWGNFIRYQMMIGELPGILVKPAWINIVGSPYVGPLGVAGVVFALLFFRRLHPMERLFVCLIGGIGIYALLSACGTHLGFAYLNYYLPLINKSREPGRHLVLFVISVVFLAGFGFDQVCQVLRKREADCKQRNRAWLAVLAMFLIGIGVVAWELWASSPLAHGGWLVLILAPVVGLIGLVFRIKATPILALAAILASVASAVSPPRTRNLYRSGYADQENLRSLEVLSAIRQKIEPGNFRLDFEDRKFRVDWWGMNASYFGYDSFHTFLETQPYDQFRFSQQRQVPYLRAMMGARYVLCREEEKPTDPGAQLRLEVQGCKIFENPVYMGRLALVHTLAGTFKSENQFIAEAGRGFDFLGSAYIQENDAPCLQGFLSTIPMERGATNDRLYFVKNSFNRVAAAIESSQPGVLILNEWFISAWKATVNGDSRAIVRINQWQLGVPVQAGKNLVEFTYRPSVSWILLILNRVTWSLLAFFVLRRTVRLSYALLWQRAANLGNDGPKKERESTWDIDGSE